MPVYKIIVNPRAGRGHASVVADQVKHQLNAQAVVYDLVETSYAGEAIRLAQRAADEGYDVLVAVGGDGTSHEVINGMMASGCGANCCLGIIPAGSGNDFAVANGIPADPAEACRLVVQGRARPVDIGRVCIDNQVSRYFNNTLGIGLDGLVTIEARKLPWLRGMPLYLLALLKTVFISLHPVHIEMLVDGVNISQATLMVNVANGQREGGGFIIAPQSKTDDGWLDMLYTAVLSRFGVLGMIPLFLKGTHLGHPAVHTMKAKCISIKSADPLFMHVDGEILGGAAHQVEIEVVPGGLRLICGPA